MKLKNALREVGLYAGIIGALTFLVFVLVFLQDWKARYDWLIWVAILPVFFLLIARKTALIGGLLLIASGIGAGIFDFYYSPAQPGQIAGRGLGYTLAFVSLPLVISGVFFLLSRENDQVRK